MIKKISLIILLFLNGTSVFCQSYKNKKLDVKDKLEGVLAKYIYEIEEGGVGGRIILYKNKRYRLLEGTDIDYVYSVGWWEQKRDTVILKSHFSKEGLSAQIIYIDTIDAKNRLFHVVENKRREPLTKAFIQINNDTTECFPLGNFYTTKPISIDSVRVRFEKGYVSKWLKVEKKPYKALLIIVNTSMDMDHFLSKDRLKFIKRRNQISKIEND